MRFWIRVEHDAQKETQDYAKAILELSKPLYSVSVEEMLGRAEKAEM